jgi:hypothetical protein
MPAGPQVFAVIVTRGAPRVKAEIEKLPDNSYYEIKDDTWFISYYGTSRKLAEQLGIRTGTNGSGVVLLMEAYSGRASSDLWEWLRAHSDG